MSAARARGSAATVATLALVLSGCGWQGLNSLPLPGTQGGGPGSIETRAETKP